MKGPPSSTTVSTADIGEFYFLFFFLIPPPPSAEDCPLIPQCFCVCAGCRRTTRSRSVSAELVRTRMRVVLPRGESWIGIVQVNQSFGQGECVHSGYRSRFIGANRSYCQLFTVKYCGMFFDSLKTLMTFFETNFNSIMLVPSNVPIT